MICYCHYSDVSREAWEERKKQSELIFFILYHNCQLITSMYQMKEHDHDDMQTTWNVDRGYTQELGY